MAALQTTSLPAVAFAWHRDARRPPIAGDAVPRQAGTSVVVADGVVDVDECFAGRTAVVTGAAGGMGFAVAKALLAAGATVTLIDLDTPPEDLADGGERARVVRGDVSDADFVADAIAGAFDASGRLDHLVNAAGVLWFGRDCSLLDIDLDVWNRVLAINLTSMVLTVRNAVPLMKRTGGGSMVHVSTTQCLRGDDHPQDAYQASKAGMIALSKSIAVQFAADRIRSNVLLPFSTDTPMQRRWQDNPELRAATARAAPLGRVGTAEDMANATLFLLSDRADYITGVELPVDGGYLARP